MKANNPTNNNLLTQLPPPLTAFSTDGTAGYVEIGDIGGSATQVSVTLTLPASTLTYAVGQVVGTLVNIPSIFKTAGSTGYIVAVRMSTNNKASSPQPLLRAHLFNASNPTVAADGVAHKELFADVPKRQMYHDMPIMDVAADSTNSDMARCFDKDARWVVTAASTSRDLWLLLEARNAFSRAVSQQITVTLVMDNNP
jgi:hypothetical protein